MNTILGKTNTERDLGEARRNRLMTVGDHINASMGKPSFCWGSYVKGRPFNAWSIGQPTILVLVLGAYALALGA
jgi:hypothetical protein